MWTPLHREMGIFFVPSVLILHDFFLGSDLKNVLFWVLFNVEIPVLQFLEFFFSAYEQTSLDYKLCEGRGHISLARASFTVATVVVPGAQ